MKQLSFWLGHSLICFLPTYVFGLQTGVIGGAYIELAQIEIYLRREGSLKGYNWFDTIIDLIFDAIGIYLAMILK